MKKFLFILVFLVNFAFAVSSYYDPNDKSFRDGFEAGLKALSLQAKVDGYKTTAIANPYPYLVVFETKNMPLHEALFLQVIATREGLESHLTKNFVTFGGFDREIDAKDIKNLVIKKFKVDPKNVKIYKNYQIINSYPYLWQDFHTRLLQDAIQKGVIVETKIVEKIKYIKTKEKAPEKKQEAIKNIVFKRAKAMAYKNIGDIKDSNDFVELGLKETRKEKFVFEKEVQTKQNEVFVKVKDENIYFSIEDIKE